ncbi:hypothetical protein [Halovenus marina]|uniref:hypothetical protein n=1 Tax=Halovenus marina TaxID=3396621 RepID=UPI003F55EE8D
MSIEDSLYEEVESAERELVERGLRPESYKLSLLAVAEHPADLPEKTLKSSVLVGVEGVNIEEEYKKFDPDNEYEFSQGVTPKPENDSGLVETLIEALEEEATIVSSTISWYSDSVVATLNRVDPYEEVLRKGSKEQRTTEVDSVEYFVKTQGEATGLKQAVELLEENGHLGVRHTQHNNDKTILQYEETKGSFSELDQLKQE